MQLLLDLVQLSVAPLTKVRGTVSGEEIPTPQRAQLGSEASAILRSLIASRSWSPLVVESLRDGIQTCNGEASKVAEGAVDALMTEGFLSVQGRALACFTVVTGCVERLRAGSLVRMGAWPNFMSSGHGRVISYQESRDTVSLANFQVDGDSEERARERLRDPTQNDVPVMRVVPLPQQGLARDAIPLDLWQAVFDAAATFGLPDLEAVKGLDPSQWESGDDSDEDLEKLIRSMSLLSPSPIPPPGQQAISGAVSDFDSNFAFDAGLSSSGVEITEEG